MKSAAFWDTRARRYAATPVRKPDVYRETLDRTASYLRRSDHVLELGCGTGTTALLLSPHVSRILASDISGEMIEIGREQAWNRCVSNVEFRQADALDPGIEGPHDVILAFNLLHLVPELDKVLARIHEMLPPGGYFISKTPCVGELSPVIRAALPILQRLGRAPWVNPLKVPALDRAIRDAGFEIVERGFHTQTAPGRFVVAQKP